MPLTFTWERQAGASGKTTYRVREVKFGDGYSLAVPDGLNNAVQVWTVTVKGDETLIQEVKAFYDLHAGATSFYWTPPGETIQLLFRAQNVTVNSIGGGIFTIVADFQQVFKP